MIAAEILFWCLLATIVYTYFVFPMLIGARAMLFPKPITSRPITPSVSVIVIAHNEEQSIGEKIENMLALDYPEHDLQIIVGSDGSTDRTCEIARNYSNRGVQFLDLPRAGKAHALNAAVAAATGDILVFSDANSMFARDAIRQLVIPFGDDRVGGVAGDQRYRKQSDGGSTEDGERAYWNLDRLMKRWESQAGHVISATGAIYAIRRDLFQPVPDGVTDDFITSTRIILQGRRLVFAEEAAAYEPVASSRGVEFGRKVRVMTRGLRGVMMVRALLNPFQFGFYSLQLFSHKVLRRLMVVPLILLFFLSGLLATQSTTYSIAFAVQVLFYFSAVIGLAVRPLIRGPLKIIVIPAYFCMVNAAALVALLNTLRGHRIDRWEPKRNVDAAAV